MKFSEDFSTLFFPLCVCKRNDDTLKNRVISTTSRLRFIRFEVRVHRKAIFRLCCKWNKRDGKRFYSLFVLLFEVQNYSQSRIKFLLNLCHMLIINDTQVTFKFLSEFIVQGVNDNEQVSIKQRVKN